MKHPNPYEGLSDTINGHFLLANGKTSVNLTDCVLKRYTLSC